MPNFNPADVPNLMAELRVGRINARHAEDLAAALGYNPNPNQEDLRALIRYAIDQGEPIGSNSNGYWIMDSVQDVDRVLNSLEQRAQRTCDRRNNLRDTWNRMNPNNLTNLPKKDVKR